MKTKTPAAVLLGRLGGKAGTGKAKDLALLLIGQ